MIVLKRFCQWGAPIIHCIKEKTDLRIKEQTSEVTFNFAIIQIDSFWPSFAFLQGQKHLWSYSLNFSISKEQRDAQKIASGYKR